MTALPLSSSLKKVRALLPVRIKPKRRGDHAIVVVDKHGNGFCLVPLGESAMARAKLIRDAMNEMQS